MFSFSQPISRLYDHDTFDSKFLRDLRNARHSVIIESPFIRMAKTNQLLPILIRLRKRGVSIIINTRNPSEHDIEYMYQSECAISLLQEIGVIVLFTVKHHRKIAIIDKEVFYEGSLNILSYYNSCEIMRRTVSRREVEILIKFIGLNKYLRKAR